MTLALVTYTTNLTPTDLLPRIERLVYGNQRTQMNRLDVTVNNTTDTIVYEFDAGGLRAGAYIEIDSEIMLVWAVNEVAKEATVQRGMLGSTAAAHSTGALIRVEPRFPMVEMMDEVMTEIRSWPTNVYARYAGLLDMGANARAIDVLGLSGVRDAQLLRARHSPLAGVQRWSSLNARLEGGQSIVAFPSSYALTIPSPLGVAGQVQVAVRAPFDPSTLGPTDDFGTIGMTPDMVDAIRWGVAGRMLVGKDVARTDPNAQGRSRPAEEVRTGEQVQVGRALLAQRDELLAEVANRLVAVDGWGWS